MAGLYDWMDKEAEQNRANSGLGEQASPDIAPPTDNEAYIAAATKRQASAAPVVPPDVSTLSNLGSAATIGGTATANPYLAATGMALQTMGQIQDRKAQQKNAQYQAEVAKINARQDAINRMAQIGAGLKA